jgi:hypothetical protein
MKSPSEMRPVGWPKKVIPYGGLVMRRPGVVGPAMMAKLPVSVKESPKLKIEVYWVWIESEKLERCSRKVSKKRMGFIAVAFVEIAGFWPFSKNKKKCSSRFRFLSCLNLHCKVAICV